MVLTQVFEMHVSNRRAEASCAILWPLLRFEEAVRRVPNRSGLPPSGFRQDCFGLGRGGKVPVSFQPYFNPFWAGVIGKRADGIGNPSSRRGPVCAGLDRVSEDAQSGRSEGGCHVGHALTFGQPLRALTGVG